MYDFIKSFFNKLAFGVLVLAFLTSIVVGVVAITVLSFVSAVNYPIVTGLAVFLVIAFAIGHSESKDRK